MITDSEFVAIRAFDKTLAQNTDNAQRIINLKNSELSAASRIIIRLRQQLAVAEARAAAAEQRHEELQRQITRAALS